MYALPNSRAGFSIMNKACAMHSLNDFTLNSTFFCDTALGIIALLLKYKTNSEYELDSQKQQS